jgi:hypothetical protein
MVPVSDRSCSQIITAQLGRISFTLGPLCHIVPVLNEIPLLLPRLSLSLRVSHES